MIIDPWASKVGLRFVLLELKEDQGLDALIKIYVRDILGHKIVMSPSKGYFDEKGKDLVAIEDESKEVIAPILKSEGLFRNIFMGHSVY